MIKRDAEMEEYGVLRSVGPTSAPGTRAQKMKGRIVEWKGPTSDILVLRTFSNLV